MNNDNRELIKRMEQRKAAEETHDMVYSYAQASPEKSDEDKKHKLKRVVQWTTDDDSRFIPAARTCGNLIPGLYDICSAPGIGTYFQNLSIKTEGLLRFPQANSDTTVNEIQKFWEREKDFKRFKLVHKRGILLWGPPGSGKSCTIRLIMEDVINRNGVAINFTFPELFMDGLRLLRDIQPQTPIVVLMEDLDEILHKYNHSEILNILDGVELLDKTVFLATTNYPEELGPRIVNRPSRFDKRFKIDHPNEESRLMYFNHIFREYPEEKAKYNLDKWVKDTEGMSLAHLKELFVAVVILEDDYKEAIETLDSMREVASSHHDSPNGIGFAGVEKRRRR